MERHVPGEWSPHEMTTVVMPWREAVWGDFLAEAWSEYLDLIHKIADSESVLAICRPEQMREAVRDLSRSEVRVIEFEYDDGWVRDNGPIIAICANGTRRAVGFEFNSWGERFMPFDGDRRLGRLIADSVGIIFEHVAFVMEGGAISVNGGGVALVVEECVLNSNRNGRGVTKSQFEDVLRQALGVLDVVWLPFGLLEDLPNTDGHVDNVAVFTGPETILAQTVVVSDPNYERLQENLAVLRRAKLPNGRSPTVVECSHLPRVEMPDGTRQPVPLINFVTTNSSVIFPSVTSTSDEYAISLFKKLYPGRSVVSTPAKVMTYGGGGPHCVTMQIPAAMPVL